MLNFNYFIKRGKIALFLLLTCAYFTNAQTEHVQIKWGTEHDTEERYAPSQVVGVENGGFYVTETDIKVFGADKHYLEYYSKDLKQVKKEEIDLKEGSSRKVIENFFLNKKGTFFLLSSYENKSQNKHYFFAQTINKNSLTPKNDLRKIVDIPNTHTTTFFSLWSNVPNKKRDGNFDFEVSSDSSKALVTAIYPGKKGEDQRFSLTVLDDEMKTLWTKNILLPYQADLFDLVGFKVDNQGRVLLLGKLYKEKRKERKSGKANYKYLMLRYDDKSEKENVIELALGDNFVTDAAITSLDNGDYICAGMYSKHGAEANGSFYIVMDGTTGALKTKNLKEFSVAFLTEGLSENRKKKVEERLKKDKDAGILTSYDIHDIIRRSDGGCVLIAEQYWVQVSQYYDMTSKTWRTTYIYHNEDIIVLNIDPQGTIEWAKKIPKWQITSNGKARIFFSYAVQVVGDKIHIIYNDDKDNVEATKDSELDVYSGEKNSITLMATLDKDGKIKRKQLFNNKDNDITSVPKTAVQISPTQMLLLGKRKSNQKFAKLTFLE